MREHINRIHFKFRKSLIIYLFIIVIICLMLIFYQQNNVNNVPEHRLQWWLSSIEWDKERTDLSGKGITIAVLDTGIDFTHNDLKSCDHEQITVIDNSDENETKHGTAIAGIISGYPHNEKGVLGIAPKAKILSIDVTNTETVDIEHLVKGIKLAINKNVDIINISIGVKKGNDELYSCIKEAYDKDIVIVASAGNYMNDEILYPAIYDEVIAVGSYNKKGDIISPKGNVKNVIFMPGANISTCISKNNYAGVQGTSFSTAIISGIIAIVKEKYPDANNKKIYTAINNASLEQNTNKITVKTIFNKFKE